MLLGGAGSAASAGAGSRVESLQQGMESVAACSGAARLEDNTQEDTLTFLFQVGHSSQQRSENNTEL